MRPHHPWFPRHQQQLVRRGRRPAARPRGKHPRGLPPPRKRKRGDPPSTAAAGDRAGVHRLLASAEQKLPQADTIRVATICDLLLDYSHEKHHAEDTYHSYEDFPPGTSASCTARCWLVGLAAAARHPVAGRPPGRGRAAAADAIIAVKLGPSTPIFAVPCFPERPPTCPAMATGGNASSCPLAASV